jgi:hypothetical protein
MSDQMEVWCAGCGRALDESPGAEIGERQPCPECGTLARNFTVLFEASITPSGSASVNVASEITASGEVGAVALDDAGTATDTLTVDKRDSAHVLPGQRIGHSGHFYISEPDEAGCSTVTVSNAHGEVVASGYGSDMVSALLEMITAMLPPDHPEYDAGPIEP